MPDLEIRVTALSDQAVRNLGQVERQLGRTTNEVKNLDKATASAGKSVGGFAQAGAKGFTDLENSAKKSLQGVQQFSDSLQRIVQATAGLFVFQQAVGFIRDFSSTVTEAITSVVRFGDEIDAVASRTGISVETLSTLKFAAEQTDTSFEALATGVRRLQVSLVEAGRNADSEAAKAFQKIGVAATNSAGQIREVADILPSIAQGIKNLGTDAEQTAAAVAIFGRSGQELVPFLQGGVVGMAELAAQTQKLGLIMSPEAARAASDLDNSLKQLNASIEALKREAVSPILAPLNQLTQQLLTLFAAARQADAKPFQGIGTALAAIVSALPGFQGAAASFAIGFKLIDEAADKAARSIERAANAAKGSSNLGNLRLLEQRALSPGVPPINVTAPRPVAPEPVKLNAAQLIELENRIRNTAGVAPIRTGPEIPRGNAASEIRALQQQEAEWRRVMGLAAKSMEEAGKKVERLTPILQGMHSVFDDLGEVAQVTRSRILEVISAFGQLATSLIELIRNISAAQSSSGGGGGGIGGFLGDLFGGLVGLGDSVAQGASVGVQQGIAQSPGVKVQAATFPPIQVEAPRSIPVELPALEVPTIPPVQVIVPPITLPEIPTVQVAPVRVETPRSIPITFAPLEVAQVPPVRVLAPSIDLPAIPPVQVEPILVDVPRTVQVTAPTLRVEVPDLPTLEVATPSLSVTVPAIPPISVNAPESIPLSVPRIALEPVVVPTLSVDVPRRVSLEAPDLRLTAPDLTLAAPDLRLEAPDLALQAPDLRLQAPDLTLRAPDLRIPDLALEAPRLTVEAPRSIPVESPSVQVPPITIDAPAVTVPPVRVDVPDLSVSAAPIPVDAPRAIPVTAPRSIPLAAPRITLRAPVIPPVQVETEPVRVDLPGSIAVDSPRAIPVDVPRVALRAPTIRPLTVEDVEIPPVRVDAPEVIPLAVPILAVSVPDLALKAPDLTLKAPDLELKAPDLTLTAPELVVAAPDIRLPTVEVEQPRVPAREAQRVQVQVVQPRQQAQAQRVRVEVAQPRQAARGPQAVTSESATATRNIAALTRAVRAEREEPTRAVRAANFSDVRGGSSSTAALPSLAARLGRIGGGFLAAIPALATFGTLFSNFLSRGNNIARQRVEEFRSQFQSELAIGFGPNLAGALERQREFGFVERRISSGPAGVFFARGGNFTAPNVVNSGVRLPFNVNAKGGPNLGLPRFQLPNFDMPRPTRIEFQAPPTQVNVQVQAMDTRGGQEYFGSQEFRNAMDFAGVVRGGR